MEFLKSQRPPLDKWQEFYTNFGVRTIFDLAATEAGQSSSLFNEFFISGFVEWWAKVNKSSHYNAKELKDSYFEEFLVKENIPLPTKYRKISKSTMHLPSAAYRSAAKYDRCQFGVEETSWSESYRYMYNHFWRMRGSDILGVEDVWTEMNKQSSPGFPWNLEFKKKSECADLMKSVADLVWEQMEFPDFGLSYVPIWNSAVKVELRAREKFTFYGGEVDKPRTFTASPCELSVVANRLFLDQNNKFYDAAGLCWSEVGASKYYGGFDRMYSRLNRFKNAFCLDESNFDASLFRKLMYGCRNFRWDILKDKWKVPGIKRRIFQVYECIVNSVIVLDNGDLIQKETGNPSGSSNTVVDNTLNLYRLFAYAYIVLCKRYNIEPSWQHFEDNVEALLFGDDNTFSCSDDVVVWFNARNICKVWSEIGVVTNASDDRWEPRLPIECDFLSHKFVKIRGMVLPSPETERILCSMLYNSSEQDVRWSLLRAFALRIESWANVECRDIFARYIEYVFLKYKDNLIGTFFHNGVAFSIKHILSINMNDSMLANLYMGKEGAAESGPFSQWVDLFKNIELFN